MKRLRYEVVDVFTDRPYAGNPLAVVLDADDLDTSQMQSLAREFHLSETAFVLSPGDGATYRVRIFTPEVELPFAGHPSVGTAATLVRLGRIPAGDAVQECGAGLLPVSTDRSHAMLTGGAAQLGPVAEPGQLLAAVGLESADFAGPPPRVAGCGISFHYLPVAAPAVARAVPATKELGALGEDGVSVFAWDPDRRVAHARVFCAAVGVAEDPATGSAALGLGVWLVASGLLPGTGRTEYTVRQGAEMHRPSTLTCSVTAEAGEVRHATVSGNVVPVASGEIAVPPFVG